jgi:legumain
VTAANFKAILEGDASKAHGGTKRVLLSTAEDEVFINFVDHGAPGIIALPNEYIYAKDLMATLDVMTKK